MAVKIFTSAGVNNLWSNPANWDLGTLPADGDSVTIPVGQTCEYDYDMTAWVTGIAGLTITGTLSLTRAAGTYKLFIKAASTINGAGTFDCGTSISIIPFSAKHLITGGAGWYINGAGGMTMTVYAAEPVIKTVLLTQNESAGATVLHVDTNTTSDIWADGDTIIIANIAQASNSEIKLIETGGIAAGTLTITSGIASAKSIGAVIGLVSRNVKFIGGSSSISDLSYFNSGKLNIGGGEFNDTGIYIIRACTNFIISGGTFRRIGSNNTVVYGSTGTIYGGLFAGVGGSYPFFSGGAFTFYNGICIGSEILFQGAIVKILNGIFKGNGSVLSSCSFSVISGGIFYGNMRVLYNSGGIIVFGGTFEKNTYGAYASSGNFKNAIFKDNIAADISTSLVTLFNTALLSNTEYSGYTEIPGEIYSESIDHDQVAGAYKAWTKGGVTSSQAVIAPTGFTQAMQTVLENAIVEGYWQKEVTVGAGASVNITSYLRKPSSMSYPPRVIVFNKAFADPFAGGAGLYTFTMTNSIDTWESEVWTYTNSTSTDVTLVIRTQGMEASGRVYSVVDVEQINVDLTTALAKLNAISGSVVEIKLKTDPITFTVTNQIDANALSGGTSASMVWQYPVREITSGGTSASEIWNYISRTITSASGLGLASGSSIESITGISASTIWEYENRTITSASAILNTLVEGAYTVDDILKIMVAVLAGKSSGGGSTEITFRDLADSLDRIVATVDASGNRSSVILDL